MSIFSLKSYRNLSDEALLERFYKKMDRLLIDRLLDRYVDKIHGNCLRLLKSPTVAEDATMEILVKVNEELRKQPNIKKFKDWLFILTRNHCYRILKKKTRFREISTDWDDISDGLLVNLLADDTLYNRKQSLIKALHQSLDTLEPVRKECLIAFYWNGMSYQEIADDLNISSNTVRTAIQSGKRNLKRLMSSSVLE